MNNAETLEIIYEKSKEKHKVHLNLLIFKSPINFRQKKTQKTDSISLLWICGEPVRKVYCEDNAKDTHKKTYYEKVPGVKSTLKERFAVFSTLKK